MLEKITELEWFIDKGENSHLKEILQLKKIQNLIKSFIETPLNILIENKCRFISQEFERCNQSFKLINQEFPETYKSNSKIIK
jgi:hypothetical protein